MRLPSTCFFASDHSRGGYTIATGLEYVIDFIRAFRFTEEDVDYLHTLYGNDSKSLFNKEFLAHLQELEQNLTVSAVSEGTLVFPQQPLVRVQGQLLLCQLVETPLLNIVNFQTLIATKAARICQAARGEPVLEFGLRRDQRGQSGLHRRLRGDVERPSGQTAGHSGQRHACPELDYDI
jgi:nicotinate phosphoribosyltransferase